MTKLYLLNKTKNALINPTREILYNQAYKHEIPTNQGSPCFITKTRSRSAKETEVYIDGLPESVEKYISEVLEHFETLPIIKLNVHMGDHKSFKLNCELNVHKDFARLAYMLTHALFYEPNATPTTDIDLRVYCLPEWKEKLKGNIGLHAGSKILRVKGKNKIQDKGALFFGLSGTGKTTLTCHTHGLRRPEGIVIKQDDVVILKKDGSCFGTENNFYIKTEGLTAKQQPLLYNATMHNTAILENICVNLNGDIDFLNNFYGTNGRAIIQRKKLKHVDNINLDNTNFIFFITRRYDITPAIAKLTPEQAALFFMLGESIETSAGDPSKAGMTKRVVGTNPFIVGDLAEEGNIFYNIIKNIPNLECYLLNTGTIGEKYKITLNDTNSIIKMIAKSKIKEWTPDKDWGYLIPKAIPDLEDKNFEFSTYYDGKTYKKLVSDLKKERKDYLKQFKGLNKKIMNSLKWN